MFKEFQQMVYNHNYIINLNMFSKIKRIKYSNVALVLINVILIIFVIPSFTIKLGETEIKYPEIDGHIFYEGSTIGNIKERKGLYPTYEIATTPNFGETELSDEQKNSIISDSLNRFTKRAQSAGLYDVEVKRVGDSIVFEFPKYYKNIADITKQLVAAAKIDFITINGAPLEIFDYDIVGNIAQTYLPALGNHLVISFRPEKVAEITAALSESGSTTQGYFYMNLDNEASFFVAKTQYTSDPEATLRLIPLAQTETIRTTLAIVKSYFEENLANDYAFTVDTNIREVPVTFPLNSLASQFTVGAVFMAAVGGLLYWMNRKFVNKRQLAIVSMFVLSTLALLKISSAVLSIVSYGAILVILAVGVVILFNYFKGNKLTRNLIRNLFIVLLVIVLFLSPISKQWAIYDIVGVLSAAICGLIVTLLLHQSLNSQKKK